MGEVMDGGKSVYKFSERSFFDLRPGMRIRVTVTMFLIALVTAVGVCFIVGAIIGYLCRGGVTKAVAYSVLISLVSSALFSGSSEIGQRPAFGGGESKPASFYLVPTYLYFCFLRSQELCSPAVDRAAHSMNELFVPLLVRPRACA